MQSIIAVTNKHTAKLRHVGSLYILTYDARKLKHKMSHLFLCFSVCVSSVIVPVYPSYLRLFFGMFVFITSISAVTNNKKQTSNYDPLISYLSSDEICSDVEDENRSSNFRTTERGSYGY